MKNRLQEVRWAKDWSQNQLARISGIPQSVISNIENNYCLPNIATALKLARALSMTVEELFTLN